MVFSIYVLPDLTLKRQQTSKIFAATNLILVKRTQFCPCEVYHTLPKTDNILSPASKSER